MSTQPQAIDAYIARKAQIDAILKRLTEASADHFGMNPETVHWGHVGNLDDYAGKLKELSDRVFHEGEYAA